MSNLRPGWPEGAPLTSMKYWRTRAAVPAATGVDIEVPSMVPRLSATEQWGPGERKPAASLFCCVFDEMVHPGARMSGLMRPSQVGPREENCERGGWSGR